MKDIVIQFSGGRDSTAVLYHLKDMLPNVIVLHVDSGSNYSHVSEFVTRTCDDLGAELHIVGPEISAEEYTEEHGYPTDILPIWVDGLSPFPDREHIGRTLISSWACCKRNLWEPASHFLTENNIKVVIRGVKKTDPHVGAEHGYMGEDGVLYLAPIWDWSEADIDNLLKENQVELPIQYLAENADSLDCWCCTAHSGYGAASAKLKFTREHYPELYKKLLKRHSIVRQVVEEQTKRVFEDIDRGIENG